MNRLASAPQTRPTNITHFEQRRTQPAGRARLFFVPRGAHPPARGTIQGQAPARLSAFRGPPYATATVPCLAHACRGAVSQPVAAAARTRSTTIAGAPGERSERATPPHRAITHAGSAESKGVQDSLRNASRIHVKAVRQPPDTQVSDGVSRTPDPSRHATPLPPSAGG